MNRTRSNLLTTLALATLVATPGIALGQQQIDDRRTVSPTVEVEIEDIIVGHVRVVGGAGNEMVVTGTIGADVDEFVIEGGPDQIEIYVDLDDWDNKNNKNGRRRWRGRDHNDVDVQLEIQLPAGASVSMEGVTAEFVVEGIDGAVEIESVTGNITYSGNAARLELTNITGSITATAGTPADVDIESVNGAISYTGGIALEGRLDAENVNGSIDLIVPGNIDSRFYVETMMGGIENDFGQQPERESRWVPSQELRFRNGAGSAEIHAETVQGAVRIRRQ